MYKPIFNQRKALRFRQFSRKGYALFACLGRVVTIGVLSVATLRSAASTATDDLSLSADTTSSSTAAAADDDGPLHEATLGNLEVTGTYAPLGLGQAARMVTVLTRDDIQAAPVHSINDLLKFLAGVDVRQRGPLGAQTDIGIRGSTQEQIAILLNGISIGDPQTGHNAMELPCDVSDILRIEVLEGPAARVYGASSLVGAINIVTMERASEAASPNPPRGWLRLEGGSFGYLAAAGGISLEQAFRTHADSSQIHANGSQTHSFGSLPLRSNLSASYTRSDGYTRSKAGALNGDFEGGKLFWQGCYRYRQLRLAWHAGVSSKSFGANTFYSAKYDEQFEHVAKLNTALQAEASVGAVRMRSAVYWNRNYDRFELIRGSEAKVPFNRHRTDVAGISVNGYFDWLLGRTALGAEMRNEDIRSTNLGEPLSRPSGHYRMGLNRTNLSLHLEHNVLLRRLTLSAGMVAVKNSWNGMPLTVYPGIDASLLLGSGWRVYASYNESLRMPSFTELYYSVGGHKADPYLKAEEMSVVEAGVKFASSRLSARASVFRHHGRNMIDWVMDTREADPVWQSVNFTQLNTTGMEFRSRLSLSGWMPGFMPSEGSTLDVDYCYQHQQKDEPSYIQSQYALEYLRHKVSARLHLQLSSRLDMLMAYRWQQRVGNYTTAEGIISDYHPYGLIDVRLNWEAARYSFYAEAHNLTDCRYADYGNVEQPGTWLTLGVKWKIL